MPLARLIAEKIDPGAIQARFLGDHLAVIRAVLAGEVEAGASYFAGLAAARRKGLDTGSLRVLAVTGRIPLDAVVARPDLDRDVAAQVASILAGTNGTTAEGRQILSQLVDVDGFVPSDDSFYDPVRQIVSAVGAVDPGVR
jgi:ABC-type phosphate/phosphonate transport system substrate-binding protein